MSPLPPSRRDILGPPPRDGSEVRAVTRHLGSYARSLDPGILDGRFATPRPVPKGAPRQLVGSDGPGDGNDYAWEYDDRHTVTAAGTQTPRLSHVPIEESLQVFWHPRGRGGLPITSELFTVDDQVVTIPDTGLWKVGDRFSFQYEYEIGDDVLDFEFIAAVTGVFHSGSNTLTFTPPPEMQEGDFLVIAARGQVAPGGGDLTLGVTSGDARVSVLYTATLPVVESVLTGFATAGYGDVVTNVIPDPSYLPGATGIMAIFRGVNSISTVTSSTSGITPQVPGTAAVAVTWNGNSSFTLVQSDPPSGYTHAGDTGHDYGTTAVSYWDDPAAEISIAGTFTGEGCLVIGLA